MTALMRGAPPICVAILLLACTPHCAWGRESAAATAAPDADFQQGKAALLEGRYAEARHYFELAENRPGTHLAEINAGIAMAELQMGQYASARQRETAVLGMVSSDHARAEAHNIIGTAWLREAGQNGGNVEQLRAAEQSYQAALKADPGFAAAYFNLGDVLQRLGRESEAAAAFKNFVRAAAEDPALTEEVPSQRRDRPPDFGVTDSKGAMLSPASLRGRIVLLDFWATWCPPCLRALPVMRELARYFPADQFLLVSIDEDSHDKEAWRAFTTKEKMDWTQVWDRDSRIYSSFALAPREELSLPRYVLLDPDGYVLRVYSGTDRLGSMAGQVVKTVQNLRRSESNHPE